MVVFFDQNWSDFGEKSELAAKISNITWIDEMLLQSKSHLSDFSMAEKMRWAARRKTIRVEDRSYSLLGLFAIHMPLLYGRPCCILPPSGRDYQVDERYVYIHLVEILGRWQHGVGYRK
jgi:hypothetical protein